MINITKNEIIEIINNHPYYEALSEYKALRKPIVRKCKLCGDIREVNARSLIEKDVNGNLRKCPVCAAKERATSLRKSHKQFEQELRNVNPNIELLSEYTTNDCKISCRCLIDGFIWDAIPHVLLQNHGCPMCANKKQNRRTHNEFIKEMNEKHPDILVLDEFEKTGKKMHFKCKTCEYEWLAVSNGLLNKDNSGCPKCSNHAKVTEDELIERLVDNKFVEYVDGYIDTMHHANFKCKMCNHIWNTLPHSILRGRKCPKCNISNGELKISEALDGLNITYISEYTFDGCKDIRNLRFDFYIPDRNVCIEYDGEQHFNPVKFGSSTKRGTPEERFKQIQYRDNLKNEYCESYNIELIRIPYTDFDNIETIINKHFS